MAEKERTRVVITLGVIEFGDRFLILRRVDDEPQWHHKWEIPGGKLDHGETTVEAIVREVKEETGLDVTDIELLGVHTHHWHLDDRIQQTVIILYRCSASSEEVVLNPHENDAYRWVTLEEFYLEENHLSANIDIIRTIYEPKIRRV